MDATSGPGSARQSRKGLASLSDFRDVLIWRFPVSKEAFVERARLIALAFLLVGLCEMEIKEGVIRIDPKDSIVFADGFVQSTEFQICVPEAIFMQLDARCGGQVVQRLFEMLNGVVCATAFKLEIAAEVVLSSLISSGPTFRIGPLLEELSLQFCDFTSIVPLHGNHQ